MNISRYRKPHFIKKEDCDPPIKLTITGAEEVTYSRSGTDSEYKIRIDLENEVGDKFWRSLNDGNLETIVKLFGDETDDWLGKEIGLKHDPSIKYKDEISGGIVVIPADEVPEKAGPPAEKSAPKLKRKLHDPAEVKSLSGNGDDNDALPF
jgi:hypothetical protein